MSTTFTLFLDHGLCVGVLEIHEGGSVRAARHLFGAVPTDPELHAWLLAHGGDLIDAARSAPAVPEDARPGGASAGDTTPVPSAPRVRNPKRAAREAARESRRAGPTTASQESLKQSLTLKAQSRRKTSREARTLAEEHRRSVRRARQRARHRGH